MSLPDKPKTCRVPKCSQPPAMVLKGVDNFALWFCDECAVWHEARGYRRP